jgi:hypothetical protein
MVLLSRARLVATNQTTGKGDFRVPDLFGCSTCIHGPLVPPFPSAARARTPTHGRVPRSARSESSGATLARGLGAFAGFSCTSCDVPPRFPRDSPRIFRVLCVDCVRRRIRRNAVVAEASFSLRSGPRAFLYHDRWRRASRRVRSRPRRRAAVASPQARPARAHPRRCRRSSASLCAGRSLRGPLAPPQAAAAILDAAFPAVRGVRTPLQRPPHLPRDP